VRNIMTMMGPWAAIERRHKRELNKDNPLGMKGLVATEFSRLVAQLWSQTTPAPSAITPSSLLVRAAAVQGHCACVGTDILGGAPSRQSRRSARSLRVICSTTHTSCWRFCWTVFTRTLTASAASPVSPTPTMTAAATTRCDIHTHREKERKRETRREKSVLGAEWLTAGGAGHGAAVLGQLPAPQ
jgi:hypothetical protein